MYPLGTIGVVRVDPVSGVLQPPSQVIDHNPTPVSDCEGAHIHEVVLAGANQTSLEVMDLGLNTVSHYSTSAQLIDSPALQVVAMSKAGSGPRHMEIHPSASWAFVLNELDSTLSTLPYSHTTGRLGEVSSCVSSLPPGEDATDMAGGGEPLLLVFKFYCCS
jgi:6-phosphogluconolactonase (cycloisomerase 2 family)